MGPAARADPFIQALFDAPGDLPTPSPALADKVESSDGLTWHIAVKPGVHFHDGAELTAEDVVYSLARHKDPATTSKAFAIASGFKLIRPPSSVSAPIAKRLPTIPARRADSCAPFPSCDVLRTPHP
jgi:ABC-type transport system substrate-binding protein